MVPGFRVLLVFSVAAWFPGGATISRPMAWPLSHRRALMRVLTPAPGHLREQVSPLTALSLLIVPSSTTLCARPSFASPISTRSVIFRLRRGVAGSPPQNAESGSFSYGPIFRRRWLPTSPHSDAVTFGYRVLASSDTDFHRAD